MVKYSILCRNCNSPLQITGSVKENTSVICKECNTNNEITIGNENIEEIDFYPIKKPYSYVSVIKNLETLKKQYLILEPNLSADEKKILTFLHNELITRLNIRLDDLTEDALDYLDKNIKSVIDDYSIPIDEIFYKKIMYYTKIQLIGFGKIDALMKDPHIEDISCDGPSTPVYIHHRDYGSIETNIIFKTKDELTKYVIKLAQKCGKHISVAKPMLDATMPDGSRIQMTLSNEITTKGSTFTIRKFRSDPITPIDLIEYNTMSPEIIAYLWLAVEHGANGLIAGGTASGKTSVLNAISLFIPKESKIVSIEETREINLPHPNWIPGIARSGFGEIINNRLIGEIDLFDLMKAALRQRPEYILVGEIRGSEAYVLFQAMATGHTTYSTVHADSVKALIHRLEGKPINIPRNMMQSLDIVLIQSNIKVKDKTLRRCKEIVEVITVDSETQEILTNSVFRWDSKEDNFNYSGKSYLLDRILERLDISQHQMLIEIENRSNILKWLHKSNMREFKDVAKIVSTYTEKPGEVLENIKGTPDFLDNKLIENSLTSNVEVDSLNPDVNFNSKNIDDENKKKGSNLLKIFKKKN
jgi:flagellar protein FlaI